MATKTEVMASLYESWDDDDLLEELDEQGQELTPWEREFLERLLNTRKERRRCGLSPITLTTKQRDALKDILEERVS